MTYQENWIQLKEDRIEQIASAANSFRYKSRNEMNFSGKRGNNNYNDKGKEKKREMME